MGRDGRQLTPLVLAKTISFSFVSLGGKIFSSEETLLKLRCFCSFSGFVFEMRKIFGLAAFLWGLQTAGFLIADAPFGDNNDPLTITFPQQSPAEEELIELKFPVGKLEKVLSEETAKSVWDLMGLSEEQVFSELANTEIQFYWTPDLHWQLKGLLKVLSSEEPVDVQRLNELLTNAALGAALPLSLEEVKGAFKVVSLSAGEMADLFTKLCASEEEQEAWHGLFSDKSASLDEVRQSLPEWMRRPRD